MGGEWVDTVGGGCVPVCFVYGRRMEVLEYGLKEGCGLSIFK